MRLNAWVTNISGIMGFCLQTSPYTAECGYVRVTYTCIVNMIYVHNNTVPCISKYIAWMYILINTHAHNRTETQRVIVSLLFTWYSETLIMGSLYVFSCVFPSPGHRSQLDQNGKPLHQFIWSLLLVRENCCQISLVTCIYLCVTI